MVTGQGSRSASCDVCSSTRAPSACQIRADTAEPGRHVRAQLAAACAGHHHAIAARGIRFTALALALLAMGCTPARQSEPMAIPDPVWADSREALVDSTQFITTSAGTASTAYGGETLRVGPNDLLEVTVFEAPELDRSDRVDNTGRISLPLLGDVIAGGLTPRELEGRLETILRDRFIRDPHVSVQVSEMQSHAVSVVGAVARPGVFQIREARPLLELIALAGGLAPNAGESVIIVRGRPSTPNGATAVVGVQADASEAAP